MPLSVYTHASDIPDADLAALREDEASANVVLSFAEKARQYPLTDPGQLWIVVHDDAENLEFVLSCTQGPLGNYPVFIVASKATAQRARDNVDLTESLVPLAQCLLDRDLAQRVFSVFSITKVTEQFAKIFVEEAHARGKLDIKACHPPYYDAMFSPCTRETFNWSLRLPFPLRGSEDMTIALRRAEMSDLDGIKVICKEFVKTSPPYKLDDKGAELEARTMIDNGQAWVHMVKPAGQGEEIACLVATTRESANVTAVTKVITAEQWRGRKCAGRLLHRVCQSIFERKERIVLYVGKDLKAARKVYEDVGFQGLSEQQGQETVDTWLEIGFKGTEIGYW